VNEWDYKTCVKSDVAEEVILGILCNFREVSKKEVIREILGRLSDIEANREVLRKYVNQLSILAQLTRLDKLTLEEVRKMPIEIDITQNAFYKYATKLGLERGMEEGIEKGIEKGLEQGREQGLEEGRKEGMKEGIKKGGEQVREQLILRLLKADYCVEEVADLLELSVGIVRSVHLKSLFPPD